MWRRAPLRPGPPLCALAAKTRPCPPAVCYSVDVELLQLICGHHALKRHLGRVRDVLLNDKSVVPAHVCCISVRVVRSGVCFSLALVVLHVVVRLCDRLQREVWCIEVC